jgi:hypothetical protein
VPPKRPTLCESAQRLAHQLQAIVLQPTQINPCMRGLGRGEAFPPSPYTHREQHLTFSDGLHRVRNVRLQHERLAAAELMASRPRLDHQLSAKTVNHDVARGSMLR